MTDDTLSVAVKNENHENVAIVGVHEHMFYLAIGISIDIRDFALGAVEAFEISGWNGVEVTAMSAQVLGLAM